MIVSGGTYVESCQEPGLIGSNRTLMGSGSRAASVLRAVAGDLVLQTAVDDAHRDEASALAATLKLNVSSRERSEPVGFHYWTPLSAPSVTGPRAEATDALVEGEAALAFGMIECETKADAWSLVYDPQQPRDLGPIAGLEHLKARRLAIVANAAETKAMSDEDDLETGARKILAATRADVVVTKQAARGALVTTAAGQEHVGPWPTSVVWPIGSGDVFAAGFAWAWGEAGAEAVEAARVGSYAASRWCSRRSLDFTAADFQPGDGELSPRDGRIYLAAPFFSLGQRWLVELVHQSLVGLGGKVFSPLHDVGVGNDEVAPVDLEGLRDCTAVLALLDEADPGAMFESGWARRGDTPLIVFSERPEDEALKMVRGAGARIVSDLPTAVYQAVWASMGFAG
jgi:pfkB family carbohydrate kinase/Nucleoside 2-deoxyribosyltransferase